MYNPVPFHQRALHKRGGVVGCGPVGGPLLVEIPEGSFVISHEPCDYQGPVGAVGPWAHPRPGRSGGNVSGSSRYMTREGVRTGASRPLPRGRVGDVGKTLATLGRSRSRSRQPGAATTRLAATPVRNVDYPDFRGKFRAPLGIRPGEVFRGITPDGMTHMLLCSKCGECCTVGSGNCKGIFKSCK